jgi:hypothetical protein
MARLNDFIRAEMLEARLDDYEKAGLGNHRNVKFAKEMIARAAGGKGFSPGQRKWVMSIIEDALPEASDASMVERIDAALAVEGIPLRARTTLQDFRLKAFNGWSLSNKQQAWLNSLLANAEQIKEHGPWVPTDEENILIKTCVKLSNRYSAYYLEGQPGLKRSIYAAMGYVNGGCSSTSAQENDFTAWNMEKLFTKFQKPLAELSEPKHPAGEMRWVPVKTPIPSTNPYQRGFNTEWHYSMVVGMPVVNEIGSVCYPMIVNGNMIDVPSEDVKKRCPKKTS